ncbi:MAG: acetolactate decarboxylase [Candidatus Nanopelagicales bacterium]|nr:acetolactate decarboxylase [Candidatus Nanopelagicales bacterium]
MTHTSTGRRLAIIATTLAAIALVASVPLATADDAPTPAGWVSQIGTFDYLVQPDYDGLAPVRDGVRGATIGLGTFDRLDGELVLIGGTTYRVGIDGIPRVVSTSRTTPWVEAVRFTPQASMRVPAGTECSALAPLIDDLAGTTGGMVAARLIGTFDVLTARSVPAQSQPYLPLAEVVATQTVFPLTDVSATLVGFRTGPDLMGVGAPGLHLHGLTKARDAGGHILGCTVGTDVRLSIQRTLGVRILAGP